MIFDPTSYLSMIWWLLDWIKHNPIFSFIIGISINHGITIAEGILVAWRPEFAGEGSIYGLSWDQFGNYQQSVKHSRLQVEDYMAVYGLLPVFLYTDVKTSDGKDVKII